MVISILIFVGHIDEEYADRIWPLFLLGIIMCLPGSYYTYLAYYAFKGYQGYDFSDIPSFNDD